MDLRSTAHALGGDVSGHNTIAIPGPGHSGRDRSLSVTFDDNAPDGFLVNSFAGDDFAACRDHVRQLLGIGAFEPHKPQPERVTSFFSRVTDDKAVKRTALAASLWDEGRPIGWTPAETYLQGRGITIPAHLYAGSVLRFHPSCPFRLDNGETVRLPALLSAMLNAETNEFQGVHRTALQPDGKGKAQVAGLDSPKKMLGSSLGAAIKLSPDDAVTTRLNIGEGIESALSVLGNFGLAPVWATMTSGNMKAFPVLPGIETLGIFADNDIARLQGGTLVQAGNHAAQECAARWIAEGREAMVWLPPDIGTDFNNLIQKGAI